jgi:hypothetical protein
MVLIGIATGFRDDEFRSRRVPAEQSPARWAPYEAAPFLKG